MVSAPVHIDGHDDMGSSSSSSSAEIVFSVKPNAPLPAPSMTRVPSAPKLTEAKSLESESKDLLGRVGITGAARRCAEYKPTLEELKETTFSDYIRGEVLGVPLPGYEFLYIHEDNKGREMKREVPLGQVPPPNYVEPIDSPAPVNAQQQSPATPKQHAGADSPSEKMKTRSQSKSVDGINKGSRTTKVVPPKASVLQPKKYQMCRYKLRDGMAKVSLPPGFWAKIDSSARGRHVSTHCCVSVCETITELIS
jgi:hypothetical protein